MQMLNQLIKSLDDVFFKCSFTEILVQDRKIQNKTKKALQTDGKQAMYNCCDLVVQFKERSLFTW